MDTVSIDSPSLYSHVGSPNAPLLLDVRRDAAFDADNRLIAGALRPPADLVEFAAGAGDSGSGRGSRFVLSRGAMGEKRDGTNCEKSCECETAHRDLQS